MLDESKGQQGGAAWKYSFPESRKDLAKMVLPAQPTERDISELENMDDLKWQSSVLFSTSVYRFLPMSKTTGN